MKIVRKWTEVFGPTRRSQFYSMKGTRALCCRAFCQCEDHLDWSRVVRLLQAVGVTEERSGSGSPVNATEYEYTYFFLGGKFTTIGGDYWGGKHGVYVEGIRVLRFLCYSLNLIQPRRIPGETAIPPLEQLQQELDEETGHKSHSPATTPKPPDSSAQPVAVADAPDDPGLGNQSMVCPFCRSNGDSCEHFFALIDRTFATVSGPASDIFNELAASDPDEGITAADVYKFVEACDESGGTCMYYVNEEGGPGMSSQEWWCWSEDVVKDLAKLRIKMGEARGKDP